VSAFGPRLDAAENGNNVNALFPFRSQRESCQKSTYLLFTILMTNQAAHESLSREEQATPSSERSFAIVMAAALAILAGINFWHGGHVWPSLGTAAVLFILTGYFAPAWLKPLNRLWFKFGLLLHRVVNPLVMGLVFYGAVLPTGIVMRALGRDLLRLKIERECDSYWIRRQPPGPAPDTMKDQF
jgi:hypothetical protein